MPARFDPTAALAEAAAKHGVHAIFGTLEPISEAAATAHNLVVMAYPDGRAPARYRRTHPNGPWIYTGGGDWEFQYVAGSDFPVFETAHGTIGLHETPPALVALAGHPRLIDQKVIADEAVGLERLAPLLANAALKP